MPLVRAREVPSLYMQAGGVLEYGVWEYRIILSLFSWIAASTSHTQGHINFHVIHHGGERDSCSDSSSAKTYASAPFSNRKDGGRVIGAGFKHLQVEKKNSSVVFWALL